MSQVANFPAFHFLTSKHSSLLSLLSNFPSSFHHNQIIISSTKFKERKSFRAINCFTSLKDNTNNSIIIADNSNNDNIWSDFQFVEVISIGNRVDSVIDFCLRSSISIVGCFRFWNVVVGRDSSRGQLHRRVLEKDVYPSIAEVPLNQQLSSKAVVLVASAGYGDEYLTAIDILNAVRSSGGLAVAVIMKPFSFEGKRRQDEVKLLVEKIQNCVNFCIDIDIDTLLKMDMVTLDEALKTAYQAVFSAINTVSILISDTYKKHIHSLQGSMTKITLGEVIKVLESYKEGRVGFGVANNVKASIVQAVYDCPFLSVGLKDIDGVICIFSCSSPIDDSEVSSFLSTFREATECTKQVIFSTVLNPDLKPNLIATTVVTVCSTLSDKKSLQNDGILSRLVGSIPIFFNFLWREDEKSGKSEKNKQMGNIFPPMLQNFMDEMLLDDNCDEKESKDGEIDIQYLELEADGSSSKIGAQYVRDQTLGRKLNINRNLRPGYRISQDFYEEEPNISGPDSSADYPRNFQLPVGVKLPDDQQDNHDKSNINRLDGIINEEVQMKASSGQEVGFDVVTGFWNGASSLLKKKQVVVSKKQGGLSARAASMLESERDTKAKWSPVMEIRYRGGVYKGRCQGGLPEGRGRLTFLDGTVYDGMWRYGKRSGIGSLFFSNGDVFHGSWRDDLMHGKGWLYFHSGERWFANFWKGRANGEGRFYSKSGEVIFGHFQDGWRHGEFLCVKVDGTRFVETWDEGILKSSEELDS